MLTKETIIQILEEIATLLELTGENPFKSRAYQNAARNLEKSEVDFDELVKENRLTEIEGIGEAISKKLTELIQTGKLEYYEKLKDSVPPGHLEMLKIPGLGPKKIHALYEQLGVKDVGELEYACLENRLVDLKGFGEKTQDNILAGIAKLKVYKERRLYAEVAVEAEVLLEYLKRDKSILSISIAGSLRRGNETVKDIDILAASKNPEKLGGHFTSYERIETVTANGETKVSVVLKSGINADLRIVTSAEYPYALHHFTGSKEHNTAMRGRAKDMGLKMNEYGLFRGEKNIKCANEEELFATLKLQFIEPELRENMGEIQAAEKNELPKLVEEKDVRGIFHVHTNFSDGGETLENMARAAREMGLQYIGISDHSRSAYYAGGLQIEDIKKQHELIDKLNKKLKPFHIFKGIEADILPDGSLDYDEKTLARFDFVIAAVHSNFNMPAREMTARLKKALQNKYATMLAHPTGRLLLSREPYAVNLEEVIDTAAKFGKAVELNANAHRLDLDWRHCIYAKRKGVKIAINPDAHQIAGLRDVSFGVKIARKGWLSSEDCLNCMSLVRMKEYLARNK
ncbi:MAG TPA: DNA polymerase/3'-5' exonuclease PolX [Smithellaceae bacterium]|nr:DNA polymerase/3'-5' exonuclease PolX [Smithellaceae bacterium]HNV64569.1 DNA polymerase/3'-5' exonuclease PolX [Smithellaceae bacterium]HNZ31808.1 DNA polymerase/3'-5' exonuclease PolX [Smithellaceae bacterium]HOD30998.1 DNA polymerase/3'-5' exonuclease PolX [Smithellaceae bacterium]HOF76877.1 DNA polymerase/3'-5' exonuclease PolX [Smithellaceae bacterium]